MSSYANLNRRLATDPKAKICLRISTLPPKAQGEDIVWVDDCEITPIDKQISQIQKIKSFN